MLVIDTETTKLKLASLADLGKQPKLIEFAAIKLDDETLEEVDRLVSFINPQEPISEEITKITKITDDMVAEAPTFAEFLPRIIEFFMGERVLVAHNLMFDVDVLKYELRRLEREHKFPWCPNWICTVEESMTINGHRMKQGDLYEHYFGEEFDGAHRAEVDTEALVRIVKAMIDDGRIVL